MVCHNNNLHFLLRFTGLLTTLEKIDMSIEHSQNINSIKKFKPNKVSKKVGSIAEFKKRAILKFCYENGIKSCTLNEIFNSNVINEIGMCYFFIYFVIFNG